MIVRLAVIGGVANGEVELFIVEIFILLFAANRLLAKLDEEENESVAMPTNDNTNRFR